MVGRRDRAAALERRADGGRPADLAQVAVVGALEHEPVVEAGEHLRVPRQPHERERGRDHADDQPAAALVARREHPPAHHREAVEEREQDGRRAHVAPDQRQAEQRAGEEHRQHRRRHHERQHRGAQPLLVGEPEPDRDPDHERLAQRVAEVLRRPVRPGERVAAAVDGLGQRGRAVQRVQRVAGHEPVHERPQQRGGRGQRRVQRALAVRGPAPHVERVEPGQRPRLRPHQPGHREQHEHRGPAFRAPRLEQHRPHDQHRERGVLVAEQGVALERRPRQHHERRDDADRRREQLRPEPVGEPDEHAEAEQDRPHHDRVAVRPERHRHERDQRLERVRRRRVRAGVVRRQPLRDVARPHERVARVVVEEPRLVDEPEQDGHPHDRRHRGQHAAVWHRGGRRRRTRGGAHPRRR